MNKEKNRNWTFVLYPESAPSNWKDYLQETGLPCAISPLHDKDLDPTGETKKAHYHILLCFPGPTTYKQVNKICEDLNCPIPKRVLSIIGIYRYFTHKDNPDKYQYNENEIYFINGFDIKEYDAITTTQKIILLKTIQKIIMDYKIFEYSQLMDYLIAENINDLYYIASTHTTFFNAYITSRRNEKRDSENKLANMVK